MARKQKNNRQGNSSATNRSKADRRQYQRRTDVKGYSSRDVILNSPRGVNADSGKAEHLLKKTLKNFNYRSSS